ncbi:hypothetical protein CBER1_09837 [Cercospora berteroae]|uniref:Enoyl reductase (ER) domain-containing protein n=1 Tax=Cercospora berteroae TaxID=357750 RepID=A0A2S6BXY9_9PEZI|nr:hypothetical protein CBER1_09837 [Cercospora berteroae]
MAYPRPSRNGGLPTENQNDSLTSSRAIVASEPQDGQRAGENWAIQDIQVPSTLKEGEILVEMVASGICHTDLALTVPEKGQTFPIVPGHEGAGYVRAVGPGVKKPVKPCDAVLLSFDSCTLCLNCRVQRPAYCDVFAPLNLFGESDVFQASGADASKGGVGGKFFGQSSFAKLSVVKETTVLPANDLIQNEEELKLFAPLGCGIQTGVGAITNLVKASPDDIVLVTGLGGVGLSAVMGAHISGCRTIVAVDKVQSRIDLAKEVFGATHGFNTTDVTDLAAALKEACGGRGASVVVETTGVPLLIEAAFDAVDIKGTFVQVAGPIDPKYRMPVDPVSVIFRGIKMLGCVEGDSVPGEFIPQLIKHYRNGKLPVDKMVKFYPAEDFKTALHDMHSGKTIKPVLTW